MPTLYLACAQTHSRISGRFFYSTPKSASWHTHTSSYELEICSLIIHTYTHTYPRLVALQNTCFSFTFTGAFLLHACGVTRNWRTYFIIVFLVETVVLQTVLWDIRAWSARFLDNFLCVETLWQSLEFLLVRRAHNTQNSNMFFISRFQRQKSQYCLRYKCVITGNCNPNHLKH